MFTFSPSCLVSVCFTKIKVDLILIFGCNAH